MHVAVRGRARFNIPALRRDDGLKRALEAGLGGNGIRTVSANPCTGNVLILFDPRSPLDEIERRVREVATRGPMQVPSVFSDGPRWHSLTVDTALGALGSRAEGLSRGEARRLMRRHGSNVLSKIARRSNAEIFFAQFANLPVALLAGTALISLMSGGFFDAAIVLAVIAVNSAIGFVSESWTEQTIASLDTDALREARVLRDGKEQLIPAEHLVPGDVIGVHRDDVVPADARLLAADRLTVNEAALTGESLPVIKAANVLAAAEAPLAERRNMLYRGSIITGGSGRAVIVATGERTEIARVQALIGMAARPQTPLQEHLDRLGRHLVLGALAASALTFVFGLLRGQSSLLMLRTAVSLGVAAVPEGLPTMVTTALAMGVRRLRARDLLVRRIEAIEGLGAVDLVCFDKTGTLTLNRMTVTRLRWNGQEARLTNGEYCRRDGAVVRCEKDADLVRLVEVCVLCNDAAAESSVSGPAAGSSTEAALIELAAALGAEIDTVRDTKLRFATVERASGRRYMATFHHAADGETLIAVKGDPMAVLALCTHRSEHGEKRTIDAAARSTIEADNLAMASAGLRVLGIAYRRIAAGQDGGGQVAELVWLGLVGMADPLRRGAAELVEMLRHAGIATVMLTGDQRATALAIAAEVGISTEHEAAIVEGPGSNGVSVAPRLRSADAGAEVARHRRSAARGATRRNDRRRRQRHAGTESRRCRHHARHFGDGDRARPRRHRARRRRSQAARLCVRDRPFGAHQHAPRDPLSDRDEPQRDDADAVRGCDRAGATAVTGTAFVDQSAQRRVAGNGAGDDPARSVPHRAPPPRCRRAGSFWRRPAAADAGWRDYRRQRPRRAGHGTHVSQARGGGRGRLHEPRDRTAPLCIGLRA